MKMNVNQAAQAHSEKIIKSDDGTSATKCRRRVIDALITETEGMTNIQAMQVLHKIEDDLSTIRLSALAR